MLRLSVFTDELCPDSPRRALDLAAKWGITHVALRSLPGGRFPAVADSELETLCTQIKETGLAVSDVSPGFFKCSPDDSSIGKALSDGLPRACEWARRLGTDMVTCFAFHRGEAGGDPPAAVVDLCGRMAAIARKHGCRLALENEAGCWGATGMEAASLIRKIGREHISLCWDPGNAAMAGSVCPYPDEYQHIKDLISHVHMKGFDPKTGSFCLMNEGAVNWAGQLGALSRDEYDGFLVIETHLQTSPDTLGPADGDLSNLENNTFQNLLFARSCLEKA